MIDKPGIYNMTAEEYHGCTEPFALGSSGARLLSAECPAMFWHQSALNPDYQPKQRREFDIGSALHLLTLEPELFAGRVLRIDADNYRTAAAQAQRAEAYETGRIPLLPGEEATVRAMREAILAHPVAREAFTAGAAEQSIFWQDAEFGVWRKTRPDYLPAHSRYIVDIKTSTSANPRSFARQAYNLRYFQQASWYMDAVEAVRGERPKRFAFIVIDKNPPHLVSVCWLDGEALEWGRIENHYALDIFTRCMESGNWPGYLADDRTETGGSFTISLPTYGTRQLGEMPGRTLTMETEYA